jgi:antitoxin component YwqK of YwqJK toxin-antitoxin module
MDFIDKIASNLNFKYFANFACLFQFVKPRITVQEERGARVVRAQKTQTVYKVVYYENENKREESGFRDSVNEGKYWLWWDNGKLRETTRKVNGLDEGLTTTYHKNGEIYSQGMSHEGGRFGIWTYWWPNGNKRAEAVFSSARSVGVWHYWNENGVEEESINNY